MDNLAEVLNPQPAWNPVDLAGGANTGDWVSLKNYGGCLIILNKDPGTTAEPAILTVLQASAVAGTGSKALAIKHGVYVKAAATDLTALGVFTKVDPTTANTYNATGDHAAVVMIPIYAEDLDSDGGFDCLSVTMADTGTAGAFGAVLYVMHNPRYTPCPSPIVD